MHKVIRTKKLGFEIYYVILGTEIVGTFMSMQYANRKAYMLNNGKK